MRKTGTIFMSFVLIALLISTPAFAQKTKVKVDGEIIKSYIEYLSTDEMNGRQTLTPEYNRAADWAAEKFREWNLEPAGDNGTFFQEVPITASRASFAWSYGIPELKVEGREFFVRDREFMLDPRSKPGHSVDAEVVFAGYGISAPGKGLDEYADLNVRGKVVLVLKGSPDDAPKAPRGWFNPVVKEEKLDAVWEEEAKDDTKILTAYDRGAAGIIIFDTDPPERPRYPRLPRAKEVPFDREFMIVTNLDAKAFSVLMRKNDQESDRGFNNRIDSIQRDIKKGTTHSFATGRSVSIKGYDSTTMYGPEFGNNVSRNIIAKITGRDRKLKNEYIIIGGHFDHIGMANGLVFNGADDNASGSAVTMELARLMVENKIRPRRTVIFALWCGEEMGLLGSYYYGNNPADGVTMDKTVYAVNMDMVGLGTLIGAPGALNFPEIWDIIMRDQDPEIAEILRPSTGGPGGSDHSAFITRGIQTLALMTRGGGGHPDYHDSGDDTEFISPDILAKTGQFVLQSVINVGNERKMKLILPDRMDRYNAIHYKIANVNTGLDISNGWKNIEADSKHSMLALAKKKVVELKDPDAGTPQFSYRRGPRIPASLGVGDSKMFEGCVSTMNLVHSVLGFGRIDVHGDDGFWFDGGITEKGEMALKSMEKNNITLNLINPTEATLDAVLNTTGKPVIITEYSAIEHNKIDLIKKARALLTVDFDLADIDGTVTVLEEMKSSFGDTKNILLRLNPSGPFDAADMDPAYEQMGKLYLTLIDKGWTRDEIYGIGGLQVNRGRAGTGGNLMALRAAR